MPEEEMVNRIVDATLGALIRDLDVYMERQRALGHPVDRPAAVAELERVVFSPEKVAERLHQTRQLGLDTAFIEALWREAIRRLKVRDDN